MAVGERLAEGEPANPARVSANTAVLPSLSAPTENPMPASETIDQAATKADKAILEAEKRLTALADRAEKTVQEGLETLRAQTRVYADSAGESIDEAQRILTEKVIERPLVATFTALGVGVLIGLLLSARR